MAGGFQLGIGQAFVVYPFTVHAQFVKVLRRHGAWVVSTSASSQSHLIIQAVVQFPPSSPLYLPAPGFVVHFK